MTELNLRGVLGIEGAAPAALACLPASRPPSLRLRLFYSPSSSYPYCHDGFTLPACWCFFSTYVALYTC